MSLECFDRGGKIFGVNHKLSRVTLGKMLSLGRAPMDDGRIWLDYGFDPGLIQGVLADLSISA